MDRILFYNFNPVSINNAHIGFSSLGYEVFNAECNEPLSDKDLEKQLSSIIDKFKPDIIFSYGWWRGRLNPVSFCNIIKSKGIFHIYWAFDDPDCFNIISLPIGIHVNLVLTTAVECIPRYRDKGVKAELILHGCYPPYHRTTSADNIYKHDIVMLANNYNVNWDPSYFAFRYNGIENMVKPLVENKYDIMVWGLWWDWADRRYNLPKENYGGHIKYGNEAKIYASSKIALGLQTVGNSESQFSVRTFEALACGVFHLSQYAPALENLFKKGVHMEWTKSAEETIEIVDFYLKDESARTRVALAGQEEVLKHHTLLHRAHSVLELIRKYKN